jgi:hypothetical protein
VSPAIERDMILHIQRKSCRRRKNCLGCHSCAIGLTSSGLEVAACVLPQNSGAHMKSSSARGRMTTLVILLGCVACCAFPIVATIGVGGVATVAVAWLTSKPVAIVLAALMALTIVGVGARALAKRRVSASSCATDCRTDQACCGPKKSA